MIPDITIKEPAEGRFIAGWDGPFGWCDHQSHETAYMALACAIGRLAGTGYPEDPYGRVPFASRPRRRLVRLPDESRPPHQAQHAKPLGSLKPDQIGHHRVLAAERLGWNDYIPPGEQEDHVL